MSSQKKYIIKHSAKELGLHGICKVGYPGVLAIEGPEEKVASYIREIKKLRWASCTLENFTRNLTDSDLKMMVFRQQSNQTQGLDVVEKMNEVGEFMQSIGLGLWWRRSMGYTKHDSV